MSRAVQSSSHRSTLSNEAASSKVASSGSSATEAADRRKSVEAECEGPEAAFLPSGRLPLKFAGEIGRVLSQDVALAIVDRKARIVWSNTASSQILKTFHLLARGSMQMTIPDAESDDRFHMLLHSGSNTERLVVRNEPVNEWVVLHCHRLDLEGKPARLIRFSLSAPRTDCRSNGFAAQFGLTPTECTVVDLFAHLDCVQAISKHMGIGAATVRSHLKHIYNKTSVHNARELVRLIVAFDAV